jgi:tetratricopeptide (TPR) repeat protein
VYSAGASLGISGASDQAIDAYTKASNLNPLNPGIKLDLARMAFRNGDVEKAKNYATEAFSLKQNYVDALIVLSQIAKSQGNNSDALSYAENAFYLSPQDQSLAQYIDSLKNANILNIPKKKN